MKETLLQRCQREAREYAWDLLDEAGAESLDEIIANTLKEAAEEVVKDIIKMSDELETECNRDGDKGTQQWMNFKGFRNAIRDKYLNPKDTV